jgi:hypothetical protein
VISNGFDNEYTRYIIPTTSIHSKFHIQEIVCYLS